MPNLPMDVAEAMRRLNTPSARRAMSKKDRAATKKELQRMIARLGATAPTATWAEWIAARDNAVRWPVKGMVLCAAYVTYLGRESRRFCSPHCATVEDMLDLMSIKQANHYKHPSSIGSVVSYEMMKHGYKMRW